MFDKLYKIVDKEKQSWDQNGDLKDCERALIRAVCAGIKADIARIELEEAFKDDMDK